MASNAEATRLMLLGFSPSASIDSRHWLNQMLLMAQSCVLLPKNPEMRV